MPTIQPTLFSTQETGSLVSAPEEWRAVPGAPGYAASSLGRIKSLTRKLVLKSGRSRVIGGRILRARTHRGYGRVSLYINGKPRCSAVHRLVMEAFYGKSSLCVNHINGNKQDNYIGNLEYVSHAENMAHAARTGLIRNDYRRGRVALSKEQAVEIIIALKEGAHVATIASTVGVAVHNVKAIKTGVSWKSLKKSLWGE